MHEWAAKVLALRNHLAFDCWIFANIFAYVYAVPHTRTSSVLRRLRTRVYRRCNKHKSFSALMLEMCAHDCPCALSQHCITASPFIRASSVHTVQQVLYYSGLQVARMPHIIWPKCWCQSKQALWQIYEWQGHNTRLHAHPSTAGRLKSCEYAMHKLLSAMHNCFPSCVAWHSPFSHLFSSSCTTLIVVRIFAHPRTSSVCTVDCTPVHTIDSTVRVHSLPIHYATIFSSIRSISHSPPFILM